MGLWFRDGDLTRRRVIPHASPVRRHDPARVGEPWPGALVANHKPHKRRYADSAGVGSQRLKSKGAIADQPGNRPFARYSLEVGEHVFHLADLGLLIIDDLLR